ncbi:zona pellucida sperm-binding protein 4-like [Xyrauchen texanus]|uniref:zona pellucida sperm-binding protein 4-like n=1 Tax=Xyrauchen texanus TaxID=154827 RepID=UPI0022421A6A|nr:zona pellucida sperm-binding protein 4-like [Xyrauchen texanus]
MTESMGRLWLLALYGWFCAVCHTAPQWGVQPKGPPAAVLRQSPKQGGLLAQNPQALVFQPNDQRFIPQQAPQWLLQQQGGIPAQSSQAPLFQPNDQRLKPQQAPQWQLQQQGGIPAQSSQALVFQPSDKRLPQQTPQQQTQKYPPKQPAPQAEPLDKCTVADYEKIQCGQPGISAVECETINCCFNGQQCYYGKAVTVQCIRDGQFVVVVARDVTLPQLSLDTVRLLGGSDPPCAPVGSTSSFAIYQFPVTACGTSMMEDNGYVVYENRMTSSYEVGIGPLGSITRDSQFELLFQCRYSGSAVQALVVEVNTIPPPPPVAAPGPLRVALRLANGQCVTKGCAEEDAAYTSYYSDSDYPVTKVLRDPVYVEVNVLERTDPNIVLTLGRCWATSTPDPLSLPQWDLLVNGCPYQDDRYLTTLVPVDVSSGLQFPTHYKRFIVKMFTFVDPASLAPLQETVFIHCSTAVCYPSSTGSCEQRCGRQRRDVHFKMTSIGETVVSSGGVTLLDEGLCWPLIVCLLVDNTLNTKVIQAEINEVHHRSTGRLVWWGDFERSANEVRFNPSKCSSCDNQVREGGQADDMELALASRRVSAILSFLEARLMSDE